MKANKESRVNVSQDYAQGIVFSTNIFPLLAMNRISGFLLFPLLANIGLAYDRGDGRIPDADLPRQCLLIPLMGGRSLKHTATRILN